MATPNPLSLKKSKLLNQSNTLINLEASFLDLKSQAELNKTCRTVSHVISAKLRPLKAEKLLDHVLNIDEKRKKEIVALLKSPDRGPLSFMLMPVSGQVKYRSSKRGNQIFPRAIYNNVSPLEAAAACGDFHLVKLFENKLPNRQKHRAGLQLQALLANPNFLSAFKRLQRAYHIYLRDLTALREKSNWTTIFKLWEHVAEAQKNLSNYGLNVFCNPGPHLYHPLPDFTKEPRRSMRVDIYERDHWQIGDLDLDSIGRTGIKLYSLYKGANNHGHGPLAFVWVDAPDARGCPQVGPLDSAAIDHLCEVLSKEFVNITARLLSYPETQEPEDAVPADVTAVVSARPGSGLDASKSRCVVS